jgi:hypothetical protein
MAEFFYATRSRLMGWSGRAPAPPASDAGKGRQRQGARHVSDTQYRDHSDRHRYRQELIPRRRQLGKIHLQRTVDAHPGGRRCPQ